MIKIYSIQLYLEFMWAKHVDFMWAKYEENWNYYHVFSIFWLLSYPRIMTSYTNNDSLNPGSATDVLNIS